MMYNTLFGVFAFLAFLVTGSSQHVPGKYPLDIKYFEIGFGGTSCDPAQRGKTHTLRFEICVDYIDWDEGLGAGQARSRNVVEADDGGPPISQVFFGHQCKGTPVASAPMNAEQFGFPANYVLGEVH